MRFSSPSWAVTIMGSALVAGTHPVAAQSSANAPGAAVDPNVSDRGSNSTTLRYIDPGNAQHSFRTPLTVANFNASWSPTQPATPITVDPSTGLAHSQGYQYRSPGVRALLDRPDYLVDVGGRTPGRNVQPNRDGAQLLLIPANTVFQLTPERPATEQDDAPPPHENYRDLRLNLRPDPASIQTPVVFTTGQPGESATTTVDAAQVRFPGLAAQGSASPATTNDDPPELMPHVIAASQAKRDQETQDAESAASDQEVSADAEAEAEIESPVTAEDSHD